MCACSVNHILKLITSYGEGAYRIFIFYFGIIRYIGARLGLGNVKRLVNYACTCIYVYIYIYITTSIYKRMNDPESALCVNKGRRHCARLLITLKVLSSTSFMYISQVRSSNVHAYRVTYVSTVHLFRPPRL